MLYQLIINKKPRYKKLCGRYGIKVMSDILYCDGIIDRELDKRRLGDNEWFIMAKTDIPRSRFLEYLRETFGWFDFKYYN